MSKTEQTKQHILVNWRVTNDFAFSREILSNCLAKMSTKPSESVLTNSEEADSIVAAVRPRFRCENAEEHSSRYCPLRGIKGLQLVETAPCLQLCHKLARPAFPADSIAQSCLSSYTCCKSAEYRCVLHEVCVSDIRHCWILHKLGEISACRDPGLVHTISSDGHNEAWQDADQFQVYAVHFVSKTGQVEDSKALYTTRAWLTQPSRYCLLRSIWSKVKALQECEREMKPLTSSALSVNL